MAHYSSDYHREEGFNIFHEYTVRRLQKRIKELELWQKAMADGKAETDGGSA
jgi:hypothetical protein